VPRRAPMIAFLLSFSLIFFADAADLYADLSLPFHFFSPPFAIFRLRHADFFSMPPLRHIRHFLR
jgi:hypothetical protein